MASKVSAKCLVEQKTGILVDEAGDKLQAKLVMMCQITPFVITEEGDIGHFAGGKMKDIYQADNRYLNLLKRQVRELKEEKKIKVF